MKILVLGCKGQIGWELARSLAPLGDLVALDRPDDADGLQADLSRPERLREAVRAVGPDVIVNAAAYTAVDKAESEPDAARIVNAEAPAMLAYEAKRSDAWLVHYSTDYVFDGGGDRPWRETDSTGPLNVYGATKLAGEESIRASGGRHLIFRTSWVYGLRGANFIRTVLRLAGERDALRVVDDQIGAPTGADLIADVTAHALRVAVVSSKYAGTYHLAAAGETSWHAYARFVIDAARKAGWSLRAGPENVEAVSSDAFPTVAERPHNSRLDCGALERAFGLRMPDWRDGVARTLSEITSSELPGGAW